jgi:hypothetical protein
MSQLREALSSHRLNQNNITFRGCLAPIPFMSLTITLSSSDSQMAWNPSYVIHTKPNLSANLSRSTYFLKICDAKTL